MNLWIPLLNGFAVSAFGICEEINAQNVRQYCENEAANLILSAFAGRAERAGISINVQVYDRSGKLFLQVTNPCRNTVRFEHGVPVSNRQGHDIGVQNICAIVERYSGIYAFLVENGWFILWLSL